VDAFAERPVLVDALAVRALHAPPPGGHAGAVVGARSVGIGVVLGLCGRAIDLDAFGRRPLGVGVLVEAAVDQMALWPATVAAQQALEHGPNEPAIRAVRHGGDVDHDLAAGHRAHLAVVGRPEAAVGHLHDTGLGVGRGRTRLALLLDFRLVGL